MPKLPHMPLWVYDIVADEACQLMSSAEFGEYIRSLMAFWRSGEWTEQLESLTGVRREMAVSLRKLRAHKIRTGSWFYGSGDGYNNDRRRRQRMKVAGWLSPRMRTKILERDGYHCLRCPATDRLTIDHILPITRGGKTVESNLQTLCRSCNARKGNR